MHDHAPPSQSRLTFADHRPTPRRLPRVRGVMAGLLLAIAAVPAIAVGAFAQSVCPDGRIIEIVIDNHSIFDPSRMPETGGLRWAYELANSAHLSTRDGFIADELLFEEGDCYRPRALRETARILRQFRFIASADVFSVSQPDGNHRVVVETRDEWSTKLSLSIRFEDRVQFDGASLFEENFLGRGITVGVFRVDRNERRDVGISLEAPHFSGSRVDTRLVMNRTRVGEGIRQVVVVPFDGELDRVAFRQRFEFERDLFAYSLADTNDYSHVVTPLQIQQVEVSAAKRFGEPGALFMVGGGVSFEHVEVGRPDEVEGIRAGDFGTRDDFLRLPSLAEIEDQATTRKATRLNLLLGVRRLDFETRLGFDPVLGVQDFPVGSQALLSVGRSVGDTGVDRPGDIFTSLQLLHGQVGERVIRVATVSIEGRREDARAFTPTRWQDVLVEAHGFLYVRHGGLLSPTLVARASAHAGWNMTSPFQITLGGPDGLRGYTDRELPGGRRVVFSIEERMRVPHPFPEFADLGVSLFGDLGQIWSGHVPFGMDSGWRGSVGGGLRLGFPSGSSTVIRADIAFPIGPGASSNGPVLRISAREWLGVLNDFRSPLMRDARRSGITGNYVGVAREGTAW